jgi:hypothetical protein
LCPITVILHDASSVNAAVAHAARSARRLFDA